MTPSDFLIAVKKNLIIEFDNDDDILTRIIASAISYAEGFQNRRTGYYIEEDMTQATIQAIILLSSYFYESRDATGGTFFTNSVASIAAGATNMWRSVNDLLRLDRDWAV